jgi:FixJ family two-component response regulator
MNYHILFVDDNKVVLKSLQALFAQEPYTLHFAKDSAGALALLSGGLEPAVIVTDQRMPGMSGTDFLQETKKICPDAMRIILTGHTDFSAAMDAINRSDIYRLIMKPWDKDDLKQAVAEAIHHFHIGQENIRLKEEVIDKNKKLTAFNEHLEKLVEERTHALEEVYGRISNLTMELQQKVSELEGHAKINQHLLTIHDLQDTLQVILSVICEVIDGEQALIYSPDQDNHLKVMAVVGYAEFGEGLCALDAAGNHNVDFAIASEVFASRKSTIIQSRSAGEALCYLYSRAFLPVIKDDQCLAVLEVRKSSAGDDISPANVKTIDQYLTPIAIAINDSLIEKDLPAWDVELDDVLQSYS